MIKSIVIRNEMGDILELDLPHPEKTGFIVKSVEGLGPPKATINSTDIPTDDGGIFNSSRITERNIVFNFEFLPNPMIEDTRLNSYKFFPLKRPVTIIVTTDRRTAECEGYVESNEPNIFGTVKDNEGCQISIRCTDPNWYAYSKTNETSFNPVKALFEFPFENDHVREPRLEFGEIEPFPIRTIFNEGDLDTGITIKMHARGNVGDITFQNTRTREKMILRASRISTLTGKPLQNKDEVTICTVRGKKSTILLRDGVVTNILNCFDRDTDWFQITRGINEFSIMVDEGKTNIDIMVENRIVYAGI